MLYYLTLFLVFWALIYTSARFLKYFRIVKDYKDQTTATVLSVKTHENTVWEKFYPVDIIVKNLQFFQNDRLHLLHKQLGQIAN